MNNVDLMVNDTVGGQISVDASDSSDSVTDGDERLRFCEGCKASVAFVIAFHFGRVGGSANTIDVCGRTIGSATSVTISLGCRGGARTIVFFVAVGKRIGVLWKHLKELTKLHSSHRQLFYA